MPLISLIVVTWNNENFIEQALASCIDDSFDDYEVIVVHNASGDRTGEMIQRAIAAKLELFTVIENERNEGLGEGRNIGMRHASGEFLMFLDGDDWYEPGTIRRVAELLRDKAPDLLLFNYQRAWSWGRTKINKLTHLLYERDISDPELRVEVMGNFCSAWNKVYRRSFVQSAQATFPRRYYEDIKWNFELLMLAKSCYVIPEALINYRQREGSILKSVDDRHMDVLAQYQDILQFFRDNPRLIPLYGVAVYNHARPHLFGENVIVDRLPGHLRGQYLREAMSIVVQWRQLVDITQKDKALIISRVGGHRLLLTARKLRDVYRRKAKKTKHQLRQSRRRIILFVYRNILCKLAVDDHRVLVESYWGKKACCNPLAIAESLREKGGYDIRVSLTRGTAVPVGFPFTIVRKRSLAYYHALATSKFLVNNVNFEDETIKRDGTVHIQTQHGTPVKSMGIDIRPHNFFQMNWFKFAKRSKRWDYVISSNPHSSEVWRRAMPYDYEIIETGYPRNDMLLNSSLQKALAIKQTLGVPQDKKVALYAPTWREYKDGTQFNLPISPARIQEALGEDYVVLLRAHHLFQNQMIYRNLNVINVSNHAVTNEVCLIADLLITDYSSIMFDYACLKRPIVLYVHDYDKYVAHRGVYFDLRQQSPGIVTETETDLVSALQAKTFESDDNQVKLRQFIAKFCPWDDGQAADRVIENLFSKETGRTAAFDAPAQADV